ncbi:FAD-binding oxidoreductase [Mesorhizobium mediterraneum]|uniref:FAD-dependent oxidoreductase n=1 Tax=Mesorhizobium mediterraneum TaxID=43617 RepID=A0AB36R8W7_9HYPH|nr:MULTISPECIES: FAD-binding oxidoreductase [Mesorhizobium]PAQ01191.1 FAD-dependent oxidoreductase [Mesorhizobium mediterraneum]RUU43961.1 FAD-binding oxidoreductase [Mesorhizobium sp. M6A.T.Ce.TU.002.03.1.1]RUU99383.1 FAD-binding oxidoreductase [Mesorhizobium sp. M6A.T.Cr.TU.017.01.1.1]RWN24546.1 MAG: FAD-binding oxidoreductase [Mesorhizobium sp.]RWN34953.1 MAG: FAD-binding oxidoreductase [Mesorhizobium sp.]
MANFSPFDATLWYATAGEAPSTRPLDETVQADVCVVGAGYTGMTTALELARAGIKVVILEAEQAGFGGSGRNAGHCTPTFIHFSLPQLRKLIGEPWAERLIQRQTRAADRVADMIERYQIQCEWVRNGFVQAAAYPSAVETLRRKADDYNAVGARTRFVDRAEMEAITGSGRFHGGWVHEEAGHLNPLGYARGLARAVIQEGGRLHTGSAVTEVKPEAGKWRVVTAKGGVLADKVIFATGAYTVGGWPKLDQSFRIMRVFVAATQPLSQEERRTVLPRNTSIHDGRGDIFVYKYNAEGRIVASMFPMGRRGRDLDYTRQVMTDRLKWLHPQIRTELRWKYLWFGELDMQQRTIPRLYGLAPGVVALTGLSGRGVPTGSMLGGILSEWALGVPERDLSLKVEPLHYAPFYMSFAPQLSLRYHRALDWVRTRRDGATLPPHA